MASNAPWTIPAPPSRSKPTTARSRIRNYWKTVIRKAKKVWNKDMIVEPDAIKLVLEQSTVSGAAALDPKRFFDNTLIKEVNRDYASKLFPGQIK